MQTDDPLRSYVDPTAFPIARLSPESLALGGAQDAAHVSRVRSILSSLPPGFSLPIPASQFLTNERHCSADNDLRDVCNLGSLAKVRSIWEAWRGDPSLKDPSKEDLQRTLTTAASTGNVDIVWFLLDDDGVPLNITAPLFAKRDDERSVEIFQSFLDHGWDINSFNEEIPSLQYISLPIPL